MRALWVLGLGISAAALVGPSIASATSVSAIEIGGKPLDVQAIVGSGKNASYEVIDFAQTGGPSYAWEYKWNTPVSGYQMLEDIAAATSLQVNATYYSSFNEHLINNFTYGSTTGNVSDYWRYLNGVYSSAKQTVTWTDSSVGADGSTISNGSFDGWYNSFAVDTPPAIPTGPATSSVPLPPMAWITLITTSAACLLLRIKPAVLR